MRSNPILIPDISAQMRLHGASLSFQCILNGPLSTACQSTSQMNRWWSITQRMMPRTSLTVQQPRRLASLDGSKLMPMRTWWQLEPMATSTKTFPQNLYGTRLHGRYVSVDWPLEECMLLYLALESASI